MQYPVLTIKNLMDIYDEAESISINGSVAVDIGHGFSVLFQRHLSIRRVEAWLIRSCDVQKSECGAGIPTDVRFFSQAEFAYTGVAQ